MVHSALSHHIIVVGMTGVGKSWLCNRLLQAGQVPFVESPGDDSCTREILSKTAFNGDVLTDTPGCLDTGSNDMVHQAAFVDFVRGKSIRAVLMTYCNRTDILFQHFLQSFRRSGLGGNVILIKNKCLDDPNAEVEEHLGAIKVTVTGKQKNFERLRTIVAAMEPIVASHLLTPISLFRQPLEIVRRETVDEYLEDKLIDLSISLKHDEIVQVPHRRRIGPFGEVGIALGIAHWENYVVPELRTLTRDEIHPKLHRVYQKYECIYARRFDNAVDLYSREVLPGQTRVEPLGAGRG